MSDELVIDVANTCPRRMLELGPWECREGLDVPVDDRCPFCGSLIARRFMERVKAHDELGPTDKDYKVYLRDPWAKFYFQHLDEPRRHEFFELLKTQQLNIGSPGYFYVLSFFIGRGEKGSVDD